MRIQVVIYRIDGIVDGYVNEVVRELDDIHFGVIDELRFYKDRERWRFSPLMDMDEALVNQLIKGLPSTNLHL